MLERLGAPIDPKARLASLSIAERRLVVIARGLAPAGAPARARRADRVADRGGDQPPARRRPARCGTTASPSLYVTHRLQEVFDVTDDVVVMRDGRMVFESPTAKVSRQRADRAHHRAPGSAVGSERWRPPAGPRDELLRVEGLTRPPAVKDASFSLHAGRPARDRRARRRGTYRARAARSSAPTAPQLGARARRGRPVRIRGPRDAMRAGIVLLPGGPGQPGRGPHRSRSARTSRCRRCAASGSAGCCRCPAPRAGAPGRAAARSSGCRSRSAHIEHPIGHLSGRQPAEGRAREVARVGRRRLHLRRADARHRRRREGGDLPPDGRPRRRGEGRRLHLVGVPRARRHLQPRARDARGARWSASSRATQVTEAALVARCYARSDARTARPAPSGRLSLVDMTGRSGYRRDACRPNDCLIDSPMPRTSTTSRPTDSHPLRKGEV